MCNHILHIIVHQTLYVHVLSRYRCTCVYTLRPLVQDTGNGVWPASPTVSQPLGPSQHHKVWTERPHLHLPVPPTRVTVLLWQYCRGSVCHLCQWMSEYWFVAPCLLSLKCWLFPALNYDIKAVYCVFIYRHTTVYSSFFTWFVIIFIVIENSFGLCNTPNAGHSSLYMYMYFKLYKASNMRLVSLLPQSTHPVGRCHLWQAESHSVLASMP